MPFDISSVRFFGYVFALPALVGFLVLAKGKIQISEGRSLKGGWSRLVGLLFATSLPVFALCYLAAVRLNVDRPFHLLWVFGIPACILVLAAFIALRKSAHPSPVSRVTTAEQPPQPSETAEPKTTGSRGKLWGQAGGVLGLVSGAISGVGNVSDLGMNAIIGPAIVLALVGYVIGRLSYAILCRRVSK